MQKEKRDTKKIALLRIFVKLLSSNSFQNLSALSESLDTDKLHRTD